MDDSKVVMTQQLLRLNHKLEYLMERTRTSQYNDEVELLYNLANKVRAKIEAIVLEQIDNPVKES